MIMILMIITRNPFDLPMKAMETCVFVASWSVNCVNCGWSYFLICISIFSENQVLEVNQPIPFTVDQFKMFKHRLCPPLS